MVDVGRVRSDIDKTIIQLSDRKLLEAGGFELPIIRSEDQNVKLITRNNRSSSVTSSSDAALPISLAARRTSILLMMSDDEESTTEVHICFLKFSISFTILLKYIM